MEEDAYNVELAAPVLMLRELERPNMALDARRPAPRNTGFAMAMVSLLHGVCDGCGCFVAREDLEDSRALTSLETRSGTIGRGLLLSQWQGKEGGGAGEDAKRQNAG